MLMIESLLAALLTDVGKSERRAITERTAPARTWDEARLDYNDKGKWGDHYLNDPVDFL